MKKIALILIILSSLANAEVYKWTDSNGTVHFSTTKKVQNAKVANLPQITKGEIKLGHLKLVSCDSHGGVDCEAGPSDTGSVICMDGFTQSSAIYRFTCNSPKLKITDVSDLDKSGLFSVTLRNAKSVIAKNTVVTMDIPQKGLVTLEGPKEIGAYGIGEFKLPQQFASSVIIQPTAVDLEVDCANCP